MARAVEPDADDARRAGVGTVARRARRAHGSAPAARPVDHADPDRARHGRRAPGRRARDDDARRPRDRRRHARRDPRQPDRARPLSRPREPEPMAEQPLLAIEGLNAYYGRAQALEDVTFEITGGSTSIIGRNGMGKTTLCNAIVGVPPARVTGSIRYRGQELVGKPSYRIAKLGIGYVPQGRRLFPSLSVDEHLRMLARATGSKRWTVERAYELFPRLRERKRNGGAQLSGGEQQMLAIARALLTNPTLLIMDEPSEGLAPAIIEHLVETFKKLEQEGLAILLIEQNLGVATSLAERQLVMVAGSIYAETTATELVEGPGAAAPLPRRRAARGAPRSGDASSCSGRSTRRAHEYAFLRDRLREHGVEVLVVDAGINEPVGIEPDISRDEVARAAGADVAALAAAGDRGAAVTAMAAGAEAIVKRAARRREARRHPRARRLGRLVDRDARDARAAGRRAEADGLDRRVGRHAPVRRRRRRDDDVLGRRHRRRQLACRRGSWRTPRARSPAWSERGSRRSRRSRSSARRCSASRRRASRVRASGSRSSATRCSSSTRPARAGSRWRRSCAAASSSGVLDATTTELADELVGGVLSAGPDRLEAAGAAGVPQVVSLGALDMVNFGPRETVPPQFEGRNLYVHNPTVTLMRTTPDECAELGRTIGRKLSAATGPTVLFVPLQGVSMIAVEGQPFYDAAADEALLAGLHETLGAVGRGARARHRHQRPGVRRRDGRPPARADRDDARTRRSRGCAPRSRPASRSSAPARAPACRRSSPRRAAPT